MTAQHTTETDDIEVSDTAVLMWLDELRRELDRATDDGRVSAGNAPARHVSPARIDCVTGRSAPRATDRGELVERVASARVAPRGVILNIEGQRGETVPPISVDAELDATAARQLAVDLLRCAERHTNHEQHTTNDG